LKGTWIKAGARGWRSSPNLLARQFPFFIKAMEVSYARRAYTTQSRVSGASEMEKLLEPTSDARWVLVTEGYDELREGIYEARLATSNGFLGVRGGRVVSRGSRWIEPQRTYIAGLFDIPGPEDPIPVLVPATGWLESRIVPTGGPLVHHPAEVSSHRTTLDMRRGALFTGCRLIDYPNIAVQVRRCGSCH
jgi:trehalose/maltose hydrolase-like predicted phosphorylase